MVSGFPGGTVSPAKPCSSLPSVSFEKLLSDKLHSSLVIRHKKSTTIQPTVAPMSSIHNKVNAALLANEASISPTAQDVQPAVIVAGTKHKREILAEYEAKYKTGSDSIITRKKVELVNPDLYDSR